MIYTDSIIAPLFKKIKQEIPFYEGKIMSYAEELLKQGRQEGMSYAKELEKRGEQRGEQKAEKEIAQKLLKSGVDSSLIAGATHLTKAQIEELKKSL
ncbi:MAG TPA: hypothetical protein VKR58_01790 [Aquella sp.]|nr:hypothetical protein [Aquella sp.]